MNDSAANHGKGRLIAAIGVVFAGLFFAAGCADKKPEEPPKKTWTLTVALGEGVDGFPQAGTYIHDPGMNCNYGYRTLDGFSDLAVKLDGEAIAAEGSILMNADHALTGTCFKRVLWRLSLPTAVYYSSPAVGDDGTIYCGSGYHQWRGGALQAVNPNGTLKWSHTVNQALFSPAIGPDGTVYVQGYDNTVYALSPDGALKWTFSEYGYHSPHNVGQHTPAIGSDGTVYIGADGLYAVDPATGRRLWKFAHPQYPARECYSSPVIGVDGTIYVPLGEDQLYAVDPDGRQRWMFAFTNDWEMSFTSPAIDANGVIYLGAEGKWQGAIASHVYAINPDGSQRWKYPVQDYRFVRASPSVGPGGRIYIATKSGESGEPAKLLALAPDGQKIWEYTLDRVHTTPDDVYSSPSIGADGLVYFGAETGYLYAVNPDGSLNWKFDLKMGINWSSPAITEAGTILIGGMEGAEYLGVLAAVKSTSLGYASTPWPRFRHDRRNTGNYGAQ